MPHSVGVCGVRRAWTSTAALLALVTAVPSQAGCGRIGFDALDGSPGAADGATDTDSFARLCDFDAHVIIEDGIALDDDVGLSFSQAVATGCGKQITRRSVSQDDASMVDTGTGRPLTPTDELIVLGGGDGPHAVVRYLLQTDTPLRWTGPPATITARATGRVIAQGTTSDTNDFVILQVVREPVGGTLSISGQGYSGEGTIAAGLYLEQTVAPQIGDQSAQWIVVEWTDTDGVAGASPDDSYTLIESG